MAETVQAQAAIEALLEEQRTFPPPEHFRAEPVADPARGLLRPDARGRTPPLGALASRAR
jgi:hypothetical protein